MYVNFFQSPAVIFKTASADFFPIFCCCFFRTTSGHVNIWLYVSSLPISPFYVVVIAKSASILFMVLSDCLSIHVHVCVYMCVHVQTTKFLLVFVCLFCLRCLSTWQWYFSCPFPACLSSCPVHIVKPHLTGSQFVAESESVFAMLFWLRFWFACSTLLHAMRNNVITISALKSPFTMHFCGYFYCNAVNSRLMVGSILMTRAFIGYFVAKIVTKLHLRWNFKMTSLLHTNKGEWNKQGSAKFSWFYVNISIIGWIK